MRRSEAVVILVIEDEIMIREIVGDYLSEAEMRAEIVTSGEAAVKQVMSSA